MTTQFLQAVEEGNEETVMRMLANGFRLPLDDTPVTLINACSKGFLAIVRLLVAQIQTSIHVQVDSRGFSCLHAACETGRTDVALYLIKSVHMNVSSLTPDRDTPLHIAARHNHADIASILIEAHAPINAKNTQGGTPFFVVRSCIFSTSSSSTTASN